MRRNKTTAWMLAMTCTLPFGAGLSQASILPVWASEEPVAVFSETTPADTESEQPGAVEEAATDDLVGDPAFGITLPETSGGSVTVNGQELVGSLSMAPGEDVTIEATSVDGYTLRSLAVDTAYTEVSPGKISFSMPEKEVAVTAAFDQIECVKVCAKKEVLDSEGTGIAYKKIPVKGASYQLVADEVVYLDGSPAYAKGEVIETLTTGEDGCAVSTKPFTGSAHLVNTGVPDVDVSVEGEEMPITFTGGMGEASYDYAAKKTDVVIKTTDEAQNGQAVTLRNVQDLTIPGGETITAGSVLGIATVADQKAVFSNLPASIYGSLPLYEVELDPAPGTYKLKKTTPVTEENDEGLLATISTKRQETKISITDLLGNPIEGATIGLYAVDEEGKAGEDALAVFTSGKSAYTADRLTAGTYQLRTLSTAPGYVYADESEGVLTFSIGKEERTKEVSLSEKKNTVSLMVVDAEDGAKTKDAGLQLYRIGSDKSRSLCTEYGDNGLLPSFVQLRGLAKGDYVAVEAKTPEGYQKAEEKAFTIDEKTENYILSLESPRTYGHVDLNLLSSVNRKPLAGGEYVLKDKDRIVATMKTDGNGKSTSIDLPIGEYADGKYLGEKTYQLYEASAPEGYEKDEKVYDITFCYLNSSVPKVAISATIPNIAVVEEVPETVTVRRKVSAGIRHGVSSNTELAANAKTSDAGNLPLQAGSTLFAALGAAACGAFRKKRTNI